VHAPPEGGRDARRPVLMIDLHTHVLPGVDDGPPDVDSSLALARAAIEDGVSTMVATPHVSSRYPNTLARIEEGVGELNLALARAELPLAIVPGAEVALSELDRLSDDDLRGLSLGGAGHLLVESPYVKDVPSLEAVLFDLEMRGVRPILAHPERSPVFQSNPTRLARLVQRGVLSSITAGSLGGRFGGRVRSLSIQLLAQGLVHSVASDAHDLDRRPPGLMAGFRAAERSLPGIIDQAHWFTYAVPRALLEAQELPARPPLPSPRRWTRFLPRR
jgi:protein-tyrosine phosphatase